MTRACTSARPNRARTARRRVTDAVPGNPRRCRAATHLALAPVVRKREPCYRLRELGQCRGFRAIGANTHRRSVGDGRQRRHRQVMLNVVPAPARRRNSMRPPCASTIPLPMYSPRPVPALLVLPAGGVVGIEDVRQILGGDARARCRRSRCAPRCRACGSATVMRSPALQNLTALPIRFWNNCMSRARSASACSRRCRRRNAA